MIVVPFGTKNISFSKNPLLTSPPPVRLLNGLYKDANLSNAFTWRTLICPETGNTYSPLALSILRDIKNIIALASNTPPLNSV